MTGELVGRSWRVAVRRGVKSLRPTLISVMGLIFVACDGTKIEPASSAAEAVTMTSPADVSPSVTMPTATSAPATPPVASVTELPAELAVTVYLSNVVPLDVLAVGDGVVVPTEPVPHGDYATWLPIASDRRPWFYVVNWTYSSMDLPVVDGHSMLPDGTVIGSDWTMSVQGPPAGGPPLLNADDHQVQLWQVGDYAVSAAMPDQCVPPDAVESYAREGSAIVSKGQVVMAYIGLIPAVGGCLPGESMTTEQFVDLLASLAICTTHDGKVTCQPLPSPTPDDMNSAITFFNKNAAIK